MKKTIEERLKFIENTPDTTVDVVVVTMYENEIYFLLNRRTEEKSDPFPNHLGLCGVYFDVKQDKTLEDAAVRGIQQKAHLNKIPHLELLGTFSSEERDPRWHTLTVVMLAYVNYNDIVCRKELEDSVELLSIDDVRSQKLAFDHNHIIECAYQSIKKDAQISAKIINFLPETFTLPELQSVYELVLGSKLDKSSFRKQVRESDLLIETGDMIKQGRGKPAQVYRLNPDFNINTDWFFPRSVAKNK